MKTKATACVYITANAMRTVAALDSLDEGQRDLLAWRPETDLRSDPGYFLAAEAMRLKLLPEGSEISAVLAPSDEARYQKHLSFLSELRGVICRGARLPQGFERSLAYWSPLEVTADHENFFLFQNLLNSVTEVKGHPRLLSNAVILTLVNVLEIIEDLSPKSFVEIRIPVDASMLGLDRERWDSAEEYGQDIHLPYERIFLKVQDLLGSPTPNFLALACIHSEQWDSSFNQ